MFCSCGPSEPDPYVGEGRFWSPPVPHRLSSEVDADELSWIQSNVDEVVVLLQRTPGLPSFPEVFIVTGGVGGASSRTVSCGCFWQNPSLLAAGTSSSSNSLTERLLRQNAELTGFVSRLTEEKNDLRNRTLRLEEELRRYRQAGLGPGFAVSSWRFWENPQKPSHKTNLSCLWSLSPAGERSRPDPFFPRSGKFGLRRRSVWRKRCCWLRRRIPACEEKSGPTPSRR